MPFEIQFSKDLTLDIRQCPHLLIIGKGDKESNFANAIQEQCCPLDSSGCEPGYYVDHDWWYDTDRENAWFMEMLEERYFLLNATNLANIEQYNQKFKLEDWFYRILLASPSILKHDASRQVLMKGRAVGMYVIMFADSVAEFGDNTDLLDMFPVKLVYKVNNADESLLVTGYVGAEKLKDNKFMLCELGKQPLFYEMGV